MQSDEYSCKWADINVDSEFNPDEGGQPVVLCHHPEGKDFCDYSEVIGGTLPENCPLFQWAVPEDAVRKRQLRDMMKPEST